MTKELPFEDIGDMIISQGALPYDDLEDMLWTYLRIKPNNVTEDSRRFVSKVQFRAFTEWCLQHPDKGHYGNRATGLVEWIDNETHHALAKQGYEWDKEVNRFKTLSEEDYRTIRHRIIEAVIRRALEINIENTYKTRDNNLRASLEGYIKNNS